MNYLSHHSCVPASYLIHNIGSRRKLPRVDLEASVDLGESLRELKNFVIGGGVGDSSVSGDTKSSSTRDNGPPPMTKH